MNIYNSKLNFFKNKSIIVLLLLAFINYIAHYFYFRRFGFYEDDYYNISQHLSVNFNQILSFVKFSVTRWVQGHPLLFLPGLFAFIMSHIGNLQSLYMVAFIIVTLNSFLVYRILNKIFPKSEIFAVTGALMFLLFPPDTTKNFLIHVFVLQVSFTFFLTSTLLYLKGWRKISYFIIPLCLLTYESPFMLFFAVPLFQGAFDKKFWQKYAVHVLILCLMIGIFSLYRISEGESRMVQAQGESLGVVYKVVMAMIIGPLMNLLLFIRAPFATVWSWFESPSYWFKYPMEIWYKYIFIYIVICFAVFMIFLNKLNNDYTPVVNDQKSNSDSIDARLYFRLLFKTLIIGIILLCLGYSVSFTHFPPTRIMGLNTSVHLAATFGGSIIFGCVCTSIIYILDKYRHRILGILLISAYLTFLVGYGTLIQQDFARSWDIQRDFYTNIVKLCPDLKDSTVIFVTEKWRMPDTRYIGAHSSAHVWAWNGIYKYPSSWVQPPKVIVVEKGWMDILKLENGKLLWSDKLRSQKKWDPFFADNNLILIKYDMSKKQFERIDSVINVNNIPIVLKPKPIDLNLNPVLKKGPLYQYLIKE